MQQNDMSGFAWGYDLPEGWQWECFDDGSGSLMAPDDTSYFSYDLATGEMRDIDGSWGHIKDSGTIAKLLAERVIPEYEERKALEAEHPDWWAAYLPSGHRTFGLPLGTTRVLLTRELGMDAKEFSALLHAAHEAEDRNRSDFTVSAEDFASWLVHAWPEPLTYEGAAFSAAIEDLSHDGSAPDKPARPVSLKDAAEASRESADALAGHDAPLSEARGER